MEPCFYCRRHTCLFVREGHSTVVVLRGHVPNADSVVIDCVYKDSKIRTIQVLLRTFHNA